MAHLHHGLPSSPKNPNPQIGVKGGEGVRFEKSILIQRPAAELYAFWRRLSNLPRIMRHLESVKDEGATSHWVAKGPLDARIDWDAEIINETVNELIAWQSLPGSEVNNAGSVRFRELPAGHGTEVKVALKYDPPGGVWGVRIAKLFGRDAETEIAEDLRHFKQVMEAGEVPSIEGQSSARVKEEELV